MVGRGVTDDSDLIMVLGRETYLQITLTQTGFSQSQEETPQGLRGLRDREFLWWRISTGLWGRECLRAPKDGGEVGERRSR